MVKKKRENNTNQRSKRLHQTPAKSCEMYMKGKNVPSMIIITFIIVHDTRCIDTCSNKQPSSSVEVRNESHYRHQYKKSIEVQTRLQNNLNYIIEDNNKNMMVSNIQSLPTLNVKRLPNQQKIQT